MRFGFIPILGSSSCLLSWLYAGFVNRDLGVILFIMSFILITIGLLLVLLFPLEKDREYITPFHRVAIIGFNIIAIPGALGILYQFDINMDMAIFTVSIVMVYCMYKSHK